MNIDRYWEPCILYIYGNPGSGKSTLCTNNFLGIYEKDEMEHWPNYNDETINYNRDTAILLDDFYGYLTWTNLLKLTDKKNA
jgi:pantothenate kinase-related protein Tda10